MLDDRMTAAHDIADDRDVGRRVELRRIVALDELDAERRQLSAHRRIDVLVRAGNPMSGGAGQCRQSSHESAADAKNVDVHNHRIVIGYFKPRLPLMNSFRLIEDQQTLGKLLVTLEAAPELALDTEFMREQTY